MPSTIVHRVRPAHRAPGNVGRRGAAALVALLVILALELTGCPARPGAGGIGPPTVLDPTMLDRG
ncbi:MAG: hypothetical protein WCH13_07815 [Deltaproteobacteria bacterium]